MAIITIEQKGSRYLKWHELQQLGVKHCFTMTPEDMGIRTNLHKENLAALYKKAREVAGCQSEKVFFPQQVHSDGVAIITKDTVGIPSVAGEYIPDTDAIITREKNYTLCSQYADCIPITVYDPVTGTLAAVHSGWRGTSKGILRKTLELFFNEFHAQPKDIQIFIWPAIDQDSFQVDQEVADIFTQAFPGEINDLMYHKEGKYYIDTVALNRHMALEAGLLPEHIHASQLSTYLDQRFHSYRRDNLGRMALIMEL